MDDAIIYLDDGIAGAMGYRGMLKLVGSKE